jgi:hypothetical protein
VYYYSRTSLKKKKKQKLGEPSKNSPFKVERGASKRWGMFEKFI